MTPLRPDPVPRTFGALTLVASVSVDGGYAVNTFAGPTRIGELCFSTRNRAEYRARYAEIRNRANAGMRAAEIVAELAGVPA